MTARHGDPSGGGTWDPDNLPHCTQCLDGRHADCPDLMHSSNFGLYACGCEHPSHNEVTT
jgi:hypothetical protein